MAAPFTVDWFMTVDGFGAPKPGTWGGYWGKQSAGLEQERLAQYAEDQRMVLGAQTYRLFSRLAGMVASGPESWVSEMFALPATFVSTTLAEPLDWADATLERGDAVDVVARLKEESPVPLRSHGSVSMNRALLDAGLVDRLQLTVFPVITGQTGDDPLFCDLADFDLELLESRTFDGGVQQLVYRPTLHGEQGEVSPAVRRSPGPTARR